MEIHREGLVLSLSQAEATTLARELAAALQLAYGTRQARPPRLLEAFANDLSRAAVPPGSASARRSGPVTEPPQFREAAPLALSDQPVRLSTKEAAFMAGVSEGYMRRCCRGREVEALEGHRGWAVDIASLTAWISRRRKETDNRKAA